MDYTSAKLFKPKKGNDWFISYSVRDPLTGKMKQFKYRENLNRIKILSEKKKEAQILINTVNAQLKSGWTPFKEEPVNPFDKLTLIELFNEFLKIKKASLRVRSYQHYKYAVDLITEYLDGMKTMPSSFTPAMAQSFADHLIVKKGFGGRSHNNQIQNMKTLFNMLIDRDVIIKNPFKNIKKKPVNQGGNLAYSDKQRKEIKEYLERNNHPMFMYVQFVYYCFIRPNELMQLQVKHINFKDKSIIIPGHISKNRKQSSVEIPDAFFELVKNKYEKLDSEFFLFGKGLVPGTTSIHRNRASASHKKVLEDLGVVGSYTLYSWKHTGNVAAWEAGVSPYKIMEQNRHHSLEQTMTYARTLGVKLKTEFASKQPKF